MNAVLQPAAPAKVAAPIVRASNIVQEYVSNDGKTVRVLDDISVQFDRPSINMLLGPSGCGKSTLMRMFGGVRPFNVKTPTSGSVEIDGESCDGYHPDVVTVFQKNDNRPDLTVRQNVMYPFRFTEWKRRVPRKEMEQRVDEMLGRVGLADKAADYPKQLSGGQNQRVALARALVLRPKVLLMDEPFGALDAQTRATMQEYLVGLHKLHPCLIVFVTHDVTEALLLGDRVLVMSSRPARIIDDFNIVAPHPRSDSWLLLPEQRALHERVVGSLRASDAHGNMRVSV